MVTALRSGPPPIPPAQPNRATETARLPEFVRGQARTEAGPAGPQKTGFSAPAPAAAAARPPAETDPSRAARTPRPGSLVDIRV